MFPNQPLTSRTSLKKLPFLSSFWSVRRSFQVSRSNTFSCHVLICFIIWSMLFLKSSVFPGVFMDFLPLLSRSICLFHHIIKIFLLLNHSGRWTEVISFLKSFFWSLWLPVLTWTNCVLGLSYLYCPGISSHVLLLGQLQKAYVSF